MFPFREIDHTKRYRMMEFLARLVMYKKHSRNNIRVSVFFFFLFPRKIHDYGKKDKIHMRKKSGSRVYNMILAKYHTILTPNSKTKKYMNIST